MLILFYIDDTEPIEMTLMDFSTCYENIGSVGSPSHKTSPLSHWRDCLKLYRREIHYSVLMVRNRCRGEKDGRESPTKTCGTHLQTIVRLPDCIGTAKISESYGTDNYFPTRVKRIP